MNRVRFAAASLALLAALAGPAHAAAPPAIVPDPTLTPGAVRTTDVGEICSHGTRELRHWDRERDDHIMAEYGLPAGPHPDFEIDHLVPLGIGGADSDANLWPEPRRSIEPQWNAETKDRLEWKLRDLVCSGQLDVAAAQRAIADNWVEAYGRFFREPGREVRRQRPQRQAEMATGAGVQLRGAPRWRPRADHQAERSVLRLRPRRLLPVLSQAVAAFPDPAAHPSPHPARPY
jgi:hypothetical protein